MGLKIKRYIFSFNQLWFQCDLSLISLGFLSGLEADVLNLQTRLPIKDGVVFRHKFQTSDDIALKSWPNRT